MKSPENNFSLYFIAILTPAHISRVITDIKQYFKETYQVSKALNTPPHITLVPPFRWQRSKIEILNTSLRKFTENNRGFDIDIQGFGAFRPRVIYAGISENEALEALWRALASWLNEDIQLGAGPDKRGFHPHITVAFKDLTPEIFYATWPEFEKKSLHLQFFASRLSLLKHNGKQWNVFRRFPFQE